MSESIRARRNRQGVSKATQQWLIDRAADRRQRRAERKRDNNAETRVGQRRALRRLHLSAEADARRTQRRESQP
jgi:hypothetical protein